MQQVKRIILNEGKKRRDSGKKRKKETISIPPKRKGKQRENKNHGIEVYNKCNVEDNSSIINAPINMITTSKKLSKEIKSKKESHVNKKKKKKIIL